MLRTTNGKLNLRIESVNHPWKQPGKQLADTFHCNVFYQFWVFDWIFHFWKTDVFFAKLIYQTFFLHIWSFIHKDNFHLLHLSLKTNNFKLCIYLGWREYRLSILIISTKKDTPPAANLIRVMTGLNFIRITCKLFSSFDVLC